MEKHKRYHLFQAYGVELEYMIVDRETLNIKPIADNLFFDVCGEYANSYQNGAITWSNELVNHVIELKCTKPDWNLEKLETLFHQNVIQINELLKKWNAMLMPGAVHPWMDPETETHIWKHGQREIYQAYDRIFGCKGHGWSNLQSTHLNLPFYDNEEFARLHAAIRILLPIIPALSASSPIIEGAYSHYLDKRLETYSNNQKKLPSIIGSIIPERVYSRRTYQNKIFSWIEEQIKPFDTESVLEAEWLNSRGAIARFDRGTIEIRIIDIQENIGSDLAILALIIEAIKLLAYEHFLDLVSMQEVETRPLKDIFLNVIKNGPDTIIDNQEYVSIFGLGHVPIKANEIWKHIYEIIKIKNPQGIAHWSPNIDFLLNEGCLAQRILQGVNGNFNHENLHMVYSEMASCLQKNQSYQVCIPEV